MSDLDLSALREEYARDGLDETDLESDPFTMFDRWMSEAHEAIQHDANAMVVSTVGADFAPSSRMVLLKGVSDAGFVFFTNTGSRKGRELAGNPRCALLFPWHLLERQVRVDGVATPLPRADVEAYFSSRPHGSQLGAVASHQSQVVADRAELEAAYADAERALPRRRADPRRVGRVRRTPGGRGVLAGPDLAPARPARLPALSRSRGRRLGHGAARAVAPRTHL